MDFNFPLILALLVFTSGLIWLLDIIILAPRRKADSKGNIAAEPLYVEYSKSFFPVLFVVFILRSFIVEPFQIPSPSMVPTLKVGDFILVNKFTYGIRLPVIRTKVADINQPQRGDVMVFFPPHESRYFIKRVIGIPGDTIRYFNNQVFVNGELLQHDFVASEAKLSNAGPYDRCSRVNARYQLFDETIDDTTHQIRKCTTAVAFSGDKTWEVPAKHYFMMGDNRDNSDDSRRWGFVPEENIVGEAFAIWMHWKGLFDFPSFSRVGAIE
ncbi:signal peptidase I [Eionea flava]